METLSTGCGQLDALVEALWPGDNVVFVGGAAQDYQALTRPALAYARAEGLSRLLLRTAASPVAADEELSIIGPADIWDAGAKPAAARRAGQYRGQCIRRG